MKKYLKILTVVLALGLLTLLPSLHASAGIDDLTLPSTGTIQLDTSTVDAFGFVEKLSNDKVGYFYSSGQIWFQGKWVIKMAKYTISTSTWDDPVVIYESPDNNSAINVAGGKIGNNVYVFFTRGEQVEGQFTDMGYIVSTDLSCNQWSSYNALDVSPLTYFYPYGHIVKTSDPNRFLQPYYGYVNNYTYTYVQFLETTDSGLSWSIGDPIYLGSLPLEETCVEYIGGGRMISHSRCSLTSTEIYQMMSSDDGQTWTEPTGIGLGANNVEIPWLYYDPDIDTLFSVFHDRYTKNTRIAWADPDFPFANPTYWPTLYYRVIYGNFTYFGYPSMVEIDNGTYMIVFSKQINSADADTGVCFVYDTNPPAPPPPPQDTPDPPTLLSPIGEGFSLQPLFQWTPDAEADSHALYVYEPPYQPENAIYSNEGLVGSSFLMPSGILASETIYRWEMKSCNDAGWGDYSTVAEFTTVAAPPPCEGQEPSLEDLNMELTFAVEVGSDTIDCTLLVIGNEIWFVNPDTGLPELIYEK